MKLLYSFNSGAFRFALVVATLFAIASLIVLFLVERSVSIYEREATASGLRSETVILMRELPDGGLSELVDTINHRQVGGIEQQFRYLLLDSSGRRLAGDLPRAAAKTGWGSIDFVDDHPPPGEEGIPETLQTLGTRLPDGLFLIIGTDTYDIYKLRRSLHNFEIVAALVVTGLALFGGYFTGVIFLRRLERVNESVGRIMAGALSERLPPIGMAPEFDRLSSNLNSMLDRIGDLMEGLRQVSTDIAHDLRTPLTRLRQSLETMQTESSVAALHASAGIALGQTDEIMAMFRALLRIGVIEAGEAKTFFTKVDLGELAERVVQIYRPAAEDSSRRILTSFEPTSIEGDPELLAQVFANLIDNALKYTPDGTAISVMVWRTDGACAAVVADDGPGIPEAERDKVLRRFYRLDSSRNAPGVGLGLSMVQAIARLHGATLELGSNNPGLWIRMTFTEMP